MTLIEHRAIMSEIPILIDLVSKKDVFSFGSMLSSFNKVVYMFYSRLCCAVVVLDTSFFFGGVDRVSFEDRISTTYEEQQIGIEV